MPTFSPTSQPTIFDGFVCVTASTATPSGVYSIEGSETIPKAFAESPGVPAESVACAITDDLCQPSVTVSSNSYYLPRHFSETRWSPIQIFCLIIAFFQTLHFIYNSESESKSSFDRYS